jgi:hypothetical protein
LPRQLIGVEGDRRDLPAAALPLEEGDEFDRKGAGRAIISGAPGDAAPFILDREVIDEITGRPGLNSTGLNTDELVIDRGEDGGTGFRPRGIGFAGMGGGDEEETEEKERKDSFHGV